MLGDRKLVKEFGQNDLPNTPGPRLMNTKGNPAPDVLNLLLDQADIVSAGFEWRASMRTSLVATGLH